jgi:putative FmdB family regulatory protein
MPLYNYKCEDCNHVQEELHPMRGPNYEVTCKKCGSKNVRKEIGSPYVQFKGPGWDTNENRGIKE